MRRHAKKFWILFFVLALVLTACGPDAGSMANQAEEGDDADLELPDPLEVDAARAVEGEAVVYYHYLMQHEHLDFNIETELPITFYANESGNWVADAMGETEVTLNMAAGSGGEAQCWVTCNLILRMVGDAKVAPISTAQCEIPMSFVFTPGDDWILESDCPDQVQETINCSALALVMADPGVYRFTPQNQDVTLQKTNQVTQEASLRIQNVPLGLQNICGW